MKTAAPELVGTLLHPRSCRPGCDGTHRSVTFTSGPASVYATYNADWRPTLHIEGADGLSGDDLLLHLAQVAYLLDPAGNGH